MLLAVLPAVPLPWPSDVAARPRGRYWAGHTSGAGRSPWRIEAEFSSITCNRSCFLEEFGDLKFGSFGFFFGFCSQFAWKLCQKRLYSAGAFEPDAFLKSPSRFLRA